MTNILRMGADRIAALCFAGMIGFGLPAVASAAVINRGVEGPPLSEIRPAPKSIYPDQQVITAQPSPSQVDPAFLGPVLLMKSAIVDLEAGTATLPLRKGRLEFRRIGLVDHDRHDRSKPRQSPWRRLLAQACIRGDGQGRARRLAARPRSRPVAS